MSTPLAWRRGLKNFGAESRLDHLHGLVAYEVLNLRNFAPENSRRKALLGKKWYGLSLEQMVIDLIQECGGDKDPSKWSLGREQEDLCHRVHNSIMVESHCLALNCDTDLGWFDNIVLRGFKPKY